MCCEYMLLFLNSSFNHSTILVTEKKGKKELNIFSILEFFFDKNSSNFHQVNNRILGGDITANFLYNFR